MGGRGNSSTALSGRSALLVTLLAIAGMGVMALLLAGCSGDDQPEDSKDHRRGGGAEAAGAPTIVPEPKAKLVISTGDGKGKGKVELDERVQVRAEDGMLTAVTVTDDEGRQVEGKLDPSNTSWKAAESSLIPDTEYRVTAVATNSDGERTRAQQTFATVPARDVLDPDVTPVDGTQMGVGMPIVVEFDEPVTNRAAVEQHLVVQTSEQVEGAWHWFGDSEVHYRPKTYWPAHADITLRLELEDVHAGNGVWGDTNETKRFETGRSVVTKVDLDTHQARIYVDGELARTIPITGGKPGWETRSGTKVVLERRTDIHFTNEAIGAEEEYDLTAPYGLRVTWSGEFLHTASWSVAHHGQANVSHGCVGMSLEHSRWLWEISTVGDPVEFTGSNRQMPVTGNGWGDWNLSWSAWKAGSALD